MSASIMAKTLLNLRPYPFMSFCKIAYLRNFTKSCTCNQQNIPIEGKLAKMLKRADKIKIKKKKKAAQPDKPTSIGLSDLSSSTSTKHSYSDGAKRRAHQVSFVLYDYIIQIINSGELSPKIADLSVEITEVKILPDLSCIHVYWAPRGTEQDDEIRELLKQNQGRLRTLLTSYRLISKIPPILFKSDNIMSEMYKVSRLLDEADYGEETVEQQLPEKIQDYDDNHSELQNVTEIFEGGVTKVVYTEGRGDVEKEDLQLEKVEDIINIKPSECDHRISTIKEEFREDVYGLNHSLLMKKIESSKHKLKHRTDDSDYIKLQSEDMAEWDKSVVNKLQITKKQRDRKTASKLPRKGGTVMEYLDEIKRDNF